MLIAMNTFTIGAGFEEAFEKRWRERTSFLDQSPGFMRFRLLKQELKKSSDTPSATQFISYTEWIDESSFLKWTESEQSRRAHSSSAPMPEGMVKGPPEFRAFRPVLDQGYGHRFDYRSPHLDNLIEKNFAKEDPYQKEILEKNLQDGLPPISIGPFEGRLIEILIRSTNAKLGIEIGTLGGYSATWLAKGLSENGKLITLELDPKRADLARSHFEKHGLSNKIEVKTGAALETLKSLEHLRDLDFVFIDADKSNYGAYTKWALPRLRKGGLLIADNAYIWGGMNYFGQSFETVKIPPKGRLDSFSKNDFTGMSDCWSQLAQHEEFASLIFPTGEGLAVAIKK